MGLEKGIVTVMKARWWHLTILPQMRHRKGRVEGDTIHADKNSISPLTPDLQNLGDVLKTAKTLGIKQTQI